MEALQAYRFELGREDRMHAIAARKREARKGAEAVFRR
jgi:uncharacterized small protein (DUF1192 family)